MVLAFALSACAGTDIEPPVENTVVETGRFDIGSAVAQAQAQREAGDLNAATATLSQLVLVAPDDPRVLAEYGKTLIDKGDVTDALAFLQRAIEISPGEWKYHSAQGVAFAQARNYRAAAISFSRALSLSPEEPSVLNNFALAQMQSGNLDQAEALLVRASAAPSSFPQIAQNLEMVRQMKLASQASAFADTAAVGTPAETTESESSAMPPQAAVETAPVPAPAAVKVAQIEPVPEPVVPAPLPANDVQPVPTQASASSPAVPAAMRIPGVAEGRVRVQELPQRAPESESNTDSESAILSVSEPEANDLWLPAGGPIYLQVGAFSSADNATRFVNELAALNPRVVINQTGEREIHRVGVGPYADRAEARLALAQLAVLGVTDVQALSSFGGSAPSAVDTLAETPAEDPAETPEELPSLRFSENR
jgi:Flp pilus assembly protein TadD